jgi:hypothetical protein
MAETININLKKSAVAQLADDVFKDRLAAVEIRKLAFANTLYGVLTDNKTQEVLLSSIPSTFRSKSSGFECHLMGNWVTCKFAEGDRRIVARAGTFNTESVPHEKQEELLGVYRQVRSDQSLIEGERRAFKESLYEAISKKKSRKSIVEDYPLLAQYIPEGGALMKLCGTTIDLVAMVKAAKGGKP